MGKYKNKFKVGDNVVCNAKYSWIRRGTTYQVKAVNQTGSIQLIGVQGNYNPDNFYLAPQRDDHVDVITNFKGFNIGDRVTWGTGATSYEIGAFSSSGKSAYMKKGSGFRTGSGEEEWADECKYILIDQLRKVEQNPSIKNEKDPLCIAFIAHSGSKLETLVKHYIDGRMFYTTDGEMIIARKSEIEQRLTSLYDSDDDVEEQWIVATLDSSITIETTKTFSVTKREINNG